MDDGDDAALYGQVCDGTGNCCLLPKLLPYAVLGGQLLPCACQVVLAQFAPGVAASVASFWTPLQLLHCGPCCLRVGVLASCVGNKLSVAKCFIKNIFGV